MSKVRFPWGLDPVFPLLDSDARALSHGLAAFVETEVVPHAMNWEHAGAVPDEAIRELGKLGCFGWAFPEDVEGGLGLTAAQVYHLSMILGFGDIGLSVRFGVHGSLGGRAFCALANDDQKRRFAADFASGKFELCFALTEPGAGANPGLMKSHCHLDGDTYVLNGSKTFISAADTARFAIVFAKEDGVDGRISALLVDLQSSGVTIPPPMKKMGITVSHTHEMFFDEVRVPRAHLLGPAGQGWDTGKFALGGGRLGVNAQSVGAAFLALAVTWPEASTRKLTRKGGTVLGFQANQHNLVDHVVAVRSATLTGFNAANAIDRMDMQSSLFGIHEAKLTGPRAAQDCIDFCLQMCGGSGYMKDCIIEKLFRDVRICRIYDGPDEVQRHELWNAFNRAMTS